MRGCACGKVARSDAAGTCKISPERPEIIQRNAQRKAHVTSQTRQGTLLFSTRATHGGAPKDNKLFLGHNVNRQSPFRGDAQQRIPTNSSLGAREIRLNKRNGSQNGNLVSVNYHIWSSRGQLWQNGQIRQSTPTVDVIR